MGLNNYAAGRAGDPPAVSLSARLKELKLPQGPPENWRHPPRIDGRSIDFSKCTEQPGDGMPGSGTEYKTGAGVQLHGQGQHAPAPAAVLDHAHQPAHARHHPVAVLTAAPCSPARSKAWGRATAPAWKTRSTAFADKDSHQIFLEPKG